MPIVGVLLTNLARLLLSGLIARIIIVAVLNAVVFGAILLFIKNFSLSSLNYALSFFSFFGFDSLIAQIQSYYSQLPVAITQTFAYFHAGALVGLFVNSYIMGIFLAWIMRKFG